LFIFSQWIIHRRPDLWEDAEQFRPERWHPDRTQPIIPFSYFPFGIGSRTCIGMPFAQLEAKLLLATILQRYTPRLLPGYRLLPQAFITLRPVDDVPMVLEETP
jgi:cytochrome P450